MSKTAEQLIEESKEIQRSILELGLREQIYQELIQKLKSLDVDVKVLGQLVDLVGDVLFNEYEDEPFKPETDYIEEESS